MKRIFTVILAVLMVFSGFSVFAVEGGQAYSLGDVNGNGKLDALDYFITKRAIFGAYTLSNEQFKIADANGSGTLEAQDYLMIKKMIFGTYSPSQDNAPVTKVGEDILLCYISEAWKDISISKDEFLPSVAYTVDGKIVDYMYDSFIFLCQPNYLYSWDSNGAAYLKPFTKSDWSNYISNEEFASDKNINALDSAVGEAKKALNDTDYKAKVYMTLFYPVTTVTSFGTVNGKNLNLSVLEDRYTAMEWMVDESIRQFNSKNYQNIELAGFYWFCEEMYETGGDGLKIAQHTTDYVRTKGLITTWCPYYKASQYNNYKALGFDIATEQANYFPEHRTDWPNKGGSERLDGVALDHQKYGIGVGMEMADTEVASALVFKEYMKAAIEKDFMQTDHIYYMSTGPELIKTLSESNNTLLRTTYDELYEFLHRTLNVDDISFTEKPVYKNTVLTGKSALFAGDSICAAGSDWQHSVYGEICGWAARLGITHQMSNVENSGEGYTTISNYDSEGRHLINQLKANADGDFDYVILQGGVNDAWNLVNIGNVTSGMDSALDESTFAGGLEATLRYAQSAFPDAKIGFIINFDVSASGIENLKVLGSYFETAKAVCDKYGVPYLDLYNNSILTSELASHLSDGVHPESSGYDILNPYIEEWMLGL